MRVTIELPCGCVLTAESVVAMCLAHDRELREKAATDRQVMNDRKRELIDTIRELGR